MPLVLIHPNIAVNTDLITNIKFDRNKPGILAITLLGHADATGQEQFGQTQDKVLLMGHEAVTAWNILQAHIIHPDRST